MQIAVDASWLGGKQGAGLGTYTTNLLKSLSVVDNINRYVAYCMRLEADKMHIAGSNIMIKETPDLLRFMPYLYSWTLWYYTGFPTQLSIDKPDILLAMTPAIPLYHACPRVVIVPDLTPMILKGAVRPDYRILFSLQVAHALRHSRDVIAISNSTKKDILNHYNIPPEKVAVVYPGYDTSFRSTHNYHDIEIVKHKYGIDQKYILFTGSMEPKKNLIRLVDAFARLKDSVKISHKLVIAGKSLRDSNSIYQKVARNGLQKEVIFTGYVPPIELPLLMAGADLFVFPSLHEGFGIPPLEAMASGVPVIVSNTSSLPEVVGDAGLLVNPYNIDEIATAIYQVITDDGLSERLKQKGLQRAKLFSWEKTAQETVCILER